MFFCMKSLIGYWLALLGEVMETDRETPSLRDVGEELLVHLQGIQSREEQATH
jgi:hypothetical protein